MGKTPSPTTEAARKVSLSEMKPHFLQLLFYLLVVAICSSKKTFCCWCIFSTCNSIIWKLPAFKTSIACKCCLLIKSCCIPWGWLSSRQVLACNLWQCALPAHTHPEQLALSVSHLIDNTEWQLHNIFQGKTKGKLCSEGEWEVQLRGGIRICLGFTWF